LPFHFIIPIFEAVIGIRLHITVLAIAMAFSPTKVITEKQHATATVIENKPLTERVYCSEEQKVDWRVLDLRAAPVRWRWERENKRLRLEIWVRHLVTYSWSHTPRQGKEIPDT